MESTPITPTIVIDGMFYQMANSGIAHLWRSLCEEWSRNGFARHLVLLDRNGTAPRIPGLRYRDIPTYDYDRTGDDAMLLQFLCTQEKADLFISTYYTTPITTPSAFMAYDMIPEVIGADLREVMWQEKHRAIMHACAYLAISENTARDLVAYFPHVDPALVRVAHCGLKKTLTPATTAEIARFRQEFGLSKPYVLVVGERRGSDDYKNALLLFRAFAEWRQRDDFTILCVGGNPELEEPLGDLVRPEDCQVLQLDEDELRAAYSGAVALVYPSRYEGFGMPVIEAMACDCPVITCRNSSLVEVAGEAALFVPETGIAELRQALEQVQQPAVRARLIAAGRLQCRRFSWPHMADIVEQTLRQTVARLAAGTLPPPIPFWGDFRRMQSRLQHVMTQVGHGWNFFAQSQCELEHVRSLLRGMESSKFWKMRQAFVRSKRLLRLPHTESPLDRKCA
jgi:glycosyltransferase involved in cell wall biosynthesis